MKQDTLITLFPSLVYKTNIQRKLNDEEKKLLQDKSLNVRKNDFNYTGVDNKILKYNEFKNLNNFVQEKIDFFVKSFIKPKYDFKCYITKSWLNFNNKGNFHQRHTHSNSFLSGVFYLNVGDQGEITFLTPFNNLFNIENKETNHFNADYARIKVKNGDLLIFYSHLEHKVDINQSNETRVSLSFNTFIKGKLNNEFSSGLEI